MAENRASANAPSLSKIELSVADGSKTTISALAKNLMPLLVVVLKADTPLCNKQLKAISELEEEGVFANKCQPIAVLIGTLNEIEKWEAKMQLKYTIVQGTPEFLEQLGCSSRGKTKRACVLLGAEDRIEFIDTAVKAGVSFVPNLKEYLATVAPRAASKPAKKTSAPRAASKKPQTSAAARDSTPTGDARAVKLKVTRRSVSASGDLAESAVTPEGGKKAVATVKKAAAKKKAPGKEETQAAKSASAKTAKTTSPVVESADAVSTSAPGDGAAEDRAADATASKNKPATKGRNAKGKKRSDPNSDIDSPTGAIVVDAAAQSRQRKRIKVTS